MRHEGNMKRAIVALVVAVLGVGARSAADWPTRPIRIIAPSTPGGAADMFGRLLCDHFGETFRERCFVENRAGAGGLIGTAATAQAAPDGYTLTTLEHRLPRDRAGGQRQSGLRPDQGLHAYRLYRRSAQCVRRQPGTRRALARRAGGARAARPGESTTSRPASARSGIC